MAPLGEGWSPIVALPFAAFLLGLSLVRGKAGALGTGCSVAAGGDARNGDYRFRGGHATAGPRRAGANDRAQFGRIVGKSRQGRGGTAPCFAPVSVDSGNSGDDLWVEHVHPLRSVAAGARVELFARSLGAIHSRKGRRVSVDEHLSPWDPSLQFDESTGRFPRPSRASRVDSGSRSACLPGHAGEACGDSGRGDRSHARWA